jgi:hypothetical protein
MDDCPAAQNGGSRASRNSKVTTQRDEGAGLTPCMVSVPGGGLKGRLRLTVLVYRR